MELQVLAPPDDLVPEGDPEGEALGIAVEHGKPHTDPPHTPEPLLDEPRQLPPVPPALLTRIHEEQADPGVGIAGVGMVRKGDHDPDEPPSGPVARQQNLHIRVRQLLVQRGRDLLRADVVRVGEVAAEGVEVTVGGVEGGEFGEEGAVGQG